MGLLEFILMIMYIVFLVFSSIEAQKYEKYRMSIMIFMIGYILFLYGELFLEYKEYDIGVVAVIIGIVLSLLSIRSIKVLFNRIYGTKDSVDIFYKVYAFAILLELLIRYTDDKMDIIRIIMLILVLVMLCKVHFKYASKSKYVFASFPIAILYYFTAFVICSRYILTGLPFPSLITVVALMIYFTFKEVKRMKLLLILEAIPIVIILFILASNSNIRLCGYGKPGVEVFKYFKAYGYIQNADYEIYIDRDQKKERHSPIAVRIYQNNEKGNSEIIRAEYYSGDIKILND